MNIERAVQALIDAGVDFLIIGGWSAILHGSVNVTNDLDVFYSRRPENLKRLASALSSFHPRLRDLPAGLPFVWDAVTLSNGSMFTLATDIGPIDLLAAIPGVETYEAAQAASVEVEAFGRTVRTLNLPTLIRAKRAAGREKDLRVLPELESLLEAESGAADLSSPPPPSS